MKGYFTRREFARTAVAGSAALTWLGARRMPRVFAAEAGKPALLGGTPTHKGGWPGWPKWNKSWEPEIVKVLRSGQWCGFGGSGKVGDFEKAYAKLLGAKHCVTMASGTTSLLTALHVVGVDAGDEVIVSPFTFIATYNAVLMHKALPIFADTDPNTMTMDPASIESCITERTRAIVPVHIYGMPCDMDPINAMAKKHNLAVVEDACQAWLGEYKGRKCGTLADLGCFSFQNSKHIPAGDGGAITGNSDELMDRCMSYHDVGRAVGTYKGKGYFTRGSNYRMTHYQAAMLVQQIDKLVTDTRRRQENADYLTAGLNEIPGIQTVRLPKNSRAVWHLYAFLYDGDQFNGLPRNKFIKALRAEGIPCSDGYHEQYNDGLLDEAINSRGFKRLYSAKRLKAYRDSFQELKGNKKVCETNVGIFQTLLLADRGDMDHIIEAIRKIQAHSEALAKVV
ncbi:MAG: DegT/DnrJ/EryC1/StrS family aminotransferase [Pirellulales bacterium]|nr:DegT/DnrJ/EryC1/StrS family aminotransferase [Pirellulales bacterium]